MYVIIKHVYFPQTQVHTICSTVPLSAVTIPYWSISIFLKHKYTQYAVQYRYVGDSNIPQHIYFHQTQFLISTASQIKSTATRLSPIHIALNGVYRLHDYFPLNCLTHFGVYNHTVFINVTSFFVSLWSSQKFSLVISNTSTSLVTYTEIKTEVAVFFITHRSVHPPTPTLLLATQLV